MFYSLYILKTVKRQFQGLSDLVRFLETVYAFILFVVVVVCFFFWGEGGYFFLLGFNFRNLILYTTNFNPTINKDIIVL